MEYNALAHYGILGMRWGVRRTPEQLARARGSKSRNTDNKNDSSTKKSSSEASTTKSPKDMSDDELNKTVMRLQLEKRYRELNPKTVSAGEKFVKTAVEKVVVPSVTEGTKRVLTDYIEKSLRKAIMK